MKHVLVLGAGLVARPLVRYLLEEASFKVTVASRTLGKAEALVNHHPHGIGKAWETTDQQGLHDFVQQADLVVSLLPANFHVLVAEVCLSLKKHLVTTSYVSEAMQSLDRRARDNGVILLNEIGLDPGIDHMSAMKVIDQIRAQGGKVLSFKSYCGGLPAPEANTTPWNYKFSWSPQGVLNAATNSAVYLEGGREIEVPAQELFTHYHFLDVPGAATFEAYPNRNSLGYIEKYAIEGVQSMFRGTLRNVGHCETWKGLADLGLLNKKKSYRLSGMTYRAFLEELLDCNDSDGLRDNIKKRLNLPGHSVFLHKLEWLGLLSGESIGMENGTALEIMARLMKERLSFQPQERDMCVMHHEFVAHYPEEIKEELITSTLVDHGEPHGDSSMARLVSLPAAIAARAILEGEMDVRGVVIPVSKAVYEPLLAKLEKVGVRFMERVGPPLRVGP